MKNPTAHNTGIRFVAGFYLVLFAVALLFSGSSGLLSPIGFNSGHSQVLHTVELDSLSPAVDVVSVSPSVIEKKSESLGKPEKSDDSPYEFEFNFSAVLQWVFGFVVRYIPVPSP